MLSLDSFVFLGFGEFFSDMSFLVKIFALVAILGFLNQHIENKTLKVIVALFIGYIMIFVDWSTFGTIYVIYAILGIGIAGIFTDFFFITGMGAGQKADQHKEHLKSQGLGGMGQGGFGQGMEPEMESGYEQQTPGGMNPGMMQGFGGLGGKRRR